MLFNDAINEVKKRKPLWSSKSRIIGRAGEIFCCKNIKCVECNSGDWLECVTNEKSKDQICKKCGKNYQIKCKNINEKSYNKNKKQKNN